MNDFTEIENELKKLRPAQPSRVLFERIEEALDDRRAGTSPARQPKRLPYNVAWWGVGLAAAAVLILFFQINLDRRKNRGEQVAKSTPAPANNARFGQGYIEQASPEARSTNGFIPAGLTQIVYHTRNEGLQFPNGYAQPLRRLRYQTHETMQWRNPATGASLRVSYPSEEVMLVPVSGQ
jgi:hypothetical protein